MPNRLKVGILSSVPSGSFSGVTEADGFEKAEITSAQREEIEAWRDTLPMQYLQNKVKFEVVNVLAGLPKSGVHDAYIIGGSPSMVSEEVERIHALKEFIHQEVNYGTPVLGICFGHQLLASAFGGKIENNPQRVIGKQSVFLEMAGMGDKIFHRLGSNFETLWSHRQQVTELGEATRLGSNQHGENQIIRVGDHARGCQFHPEFSKEFTSFLVKLMKGSIAEEGLNVDEILAEIASMKGNQGKNVIRFFVDFVENM